MVISREQADVATPSGPMRIHVYRPGPAGRYPGVLMYSEIFQRTGPIDRSAAFLAGQGYVVGVPEIYHELEPAGTVLAYDTAGADRGNAHKVAKEISAYDADARAGLDFLAGHAACSGRLGAIGFCIGGHLAYRAALWPDCRAAVCFQATDLHKRSLGKGMSDDSLARAGDVRAELMFVWGRQDPHIPVEGRQLIYQRLTDAGVRFSWHEFNAEHAAMRDEGHRYDAAVARLTWELALEMLGRRLGGEG